MRVYLAPHVILLFLKGLHLQFVLRHLFQHLQKGRKGQDYFQSVTFHLVARDNLLCITHELPLQLVLLLRLLQDHVCLSEFGLQQFLLEVPVFEHLLQVLEKDN